MDRKEMIIPDLVYIVLLVLLIPVILIYLVSMLQYVIEDVIQDYPVGFPPSEYFAPEEWIKISGSSSIIALLYSIGLTKIKTTRGISLLTSLVTYLSFIPFLYSYYKVFVFLYKGTNPDESITILYSSFSLLFLLYFLANRERWGVEVNISGNERH